VKRHFNLIVPFRVAEGENPQETMEEMLDFVGLGTCEATYETISRDEPEKAVVGLRGMGNTYHVAHHHTHEAIVEVPFNDAYVPQHCQRLEWGNSVQRAFHSIGKMLDGFYLADSAGRLGASRSGFDSPDRTIGYSIAWDKVIHEGFIVGQFVATSAYTNEVIKDWLKANETFRWMFNRLKECNAKAIPITKENVFNLYNKTWDSKLPEFQRKNEGTLVNRLMSDFQYLGFIPNPGFDKSQWTYKFNKERFDEFKDAPNA